MLIAQITDLHISLPGRRAHDLYRTGEHLARWVERLNGLEPAPDLVLATGDLVNDGEAEEYASLAALLAPLRMPVYLIPGNHDDRENLLAGFPGHAYLPRDSEFLHYVVEGHPLRLIGLDTHKPGHVGGEICPARAAWLGQRLAEAPERSTLIFMHHPPFRTGMAKMDPGCLEGAERVVREISAHDNIERVIAGHMHRAIFRRLAGTVLSVAPATAHQIALEFTGDGRPTMTAEPPSCHLHFWLGGADGLVSHTLHLDENAFPPRA